MTNPLVILDIGSSLVTGPARGPASRIAQAAGLNKTQKRQLHQLLMTTDFANPGEAYESASTELGLDDQHVQSAVVDVWQAQETEARLIPGAAEALGRFADSGYRLALLSNIWVPYFHSVHRLLGKLFDKYIPAELQLLSFREGLSKPAPELFKRVLDRAGADATMTLMVGDSYRKDMEPAISLGMRTLWLLQDPGHDADSLVEVLNERAPRPNVTLRSLADIDSVPLWSGTDMPRTGDEGAYASAAWRA